MTEPGLGRHWAPTLVRVFEVAIRPVQGQRGEVPIELSRSRSVPIEPRDNDDRDNDVRV